MVVLFGSVRDQMRIVDVRHVEDTVKGTEEAVVVVVVMMKLSMT